MRDMGIFRSQSASPTSQKGDTGNQTDETCISVPALTLQPRSLAQERTDRGNGHKAQGPTVPSLVDGLEGLLTRGDVT